MRPLSKWSAARSPFTVAQSMSASEALRRTDMARAWRTLAPRLKDPRGEGALEPVPWTPPNGHARCLRSCYRLPVPVWLSDAEYRILTAACARMIPADDEAPGAAEAGVADYIDRLLGAFSFDPPRIWAGGPSRGGSAGRPGSRGSTAWARSTSWPGGPGSRDRTGIPEREFNGPVVGLQERYRAGLAALGADFCDLSAEEQDERLRADRGVHRRWCTSTPVRGCTARPSTAATGGCRLAEHRLRRRRPAAGLHRRRGERTVTVDADHRRVRAREARRRPTS